MATAPKPLQDLFTELEKQHPDCQLRDLRGLWAITVWHQTSDRYPTATVTFADDEFGWGHSWEFTQPADAPLDEVARQIVASLPEQSQRLNG